MIKKALTKINTGHMSFEVTDNHIQSVLEELKSINNKRVKILTLLTIVIETVLILALDVPALITNYNNLVSHLYLYTHFSILFFAGVIFYISHRFEKNKKAKIYKHFYWMNNFIFMMFMAVIGCLDQVSFGSIVSYIVMLLICGVVTLLPSSNGYMAYTGPHILFLFLLYKYSEKNQLLWANMINSTIFYICTMFFTRILYKNQITHLAKNIILEEINKKLEYFSNYDELTGLANRRFFESMVKNYLKKSGVPKENSVIVMMDIDYFKKINDTYGHHSGDLVLKEISEIIREFINYPNLLGRWGGEEFIMFFPENSEEDVENHLKLLKDSIEKKEIILDNKTFHITASFGFAKFISDSDKIAFEETFKIVDKALYVAKRTGRNQIVKGVY